MSPVRIMHVDDEPEVLEAVRLSLGRDPDIVVRSCASGVEALAAIRDWPPDLVLLDVMMPFLDGAAMLSMLRTDRHTATVPIVFLTGRNDPQEREYFESLGVAAVLGKPFDTRSLAATLRKFLSPEPPPAHVARDRFLDHATECANELRERMIDLAAGANDASGLEQMRQTAIRLANAAETAGFRKIGAHATKLENALAAEQNSAAVRAALDELLARIASIAERASTALRSGAQTPGRTASSKAG